MAASTSEVAKSEASYTGAEPDHLRELSEHLLASTDMTIIVEGVGLPCHKQIMALHSKVFAGMAELITGYRHGASSACNVRQGASRILQC